MAWPIGILMLLGAGYYASRVLPRALERMNAPATAAASRALLYRQYEHPFFSKMSRDEALLILGFDANAAPTEPEIKQKYRQCVSQFHSDIGGSDVISQKLNEAKDLLTKPSP